MDPLLLALRKNLAPWEAWWGSNTSGFSQRVLGIRSERGPPGSQDPERKAEASTQKTPARQAPSEMGGKADGTASSPETDQGPKGTGKDRPSSQYMKALQGQLVHQSSLHTCRQPKRNGLKAPPAQWDGYITIGTWLVFPAGTRGTPAKIVPVVSRQGSHAQRTLASHEDASEASRARRDEPPKQVGGPTSQRLGKR